MNVVIDLPPMYREIVRRFPAAMSNGVVFTWGDTLYNPSGTHIGPDLFVHEELHTAQQVWVGGPEAWWRRYFIDPAFVLDQEARAYGRQLAWIHAHHPNRGRRARELHQLARELASPIYGPCCTFAAAQKLIRGYA